MGMKYKTCGICGGELIGETGQGHPMCSACRDRLLDDMRDARPANRVFPANWSFDDKIDKARELGISYGIFIANANDGMYDFKKMKKAKKITPAEIKRRRRLVW